MNLDASIAEDTTPQKETPCGFTLVVLQSSSLCNLNCRYCYVPGRMAAEKMNNETLDAAFRLTVGAEDRRKITHEFLWHAGEPLAVGLPFIRNAVERCVDIALADTRFQFTLQTNGVLVTPQWAHFLKEWNFGVGISIDGPHFLHDANRRNWANEPTHDKARRGLDILLNEGCNTSVLAVLTKDSLDYPDEIFDYFLASGTPGLGFNIEEIENQNTETSFGANPMGKHNKDAHQRRVRAFFDRLFERWWPQRDKIQIREFVDVMRCASAFRVDNGFSRSPDEGRMLGIVTIMRNGKVATFSPEFAGATSSTYGDFVVGDVHTMSSLNDILASPVYARLKNDIQSGITACRDNCVYYPICGSSFISNRYFEHGTFLQPETFTCVAMRQTVAEAVFAGLAREAKKSQVQSINA